MVRAHFYLSDESFSHLKAYREQYGVSMSKQLDMMMRHRILTKRAKDSMPPPTDRTDIIYLEYAMNHGMTVESMTEEQKKLAYANYMMAKGLDLTLPTKRSVWERFKDWLSFI